MSLAAAVSNAGFDPPRLLFSIRTAVAACVALVVAWALGLEHPQWSAMTVWAASQPLRGMLIEKGFFRAVGTVIGVIFGVLLVVAADGQIWVLAAGLRAWITLSAGVANVLRGLVAYGALLAGYSASMVALLDTGHPDQVWILGLDRLATVLVGVVIASLVGLAVKAGSGADDALRRTRRLTGRILRDLAARLEGKPDHDGDAEERAILSEMAIIDELLDPHGAGSLRSRRSAATLRAVLLSHVEGLLLLKGADLGPPDPGLANAFVGAAEVLEGPGGSEDVEAAFEKLARQAVGHPDLAPMLEQLRTIARERVGLRDEGRANLKALPPIVLHRDWVGARQAAIRAGLLMALLSAVWVGFDLPSGGFLLLGASVMITLFSTFDSPAGIMPHVILGQVGGCVAALACRWLVWPMAGAEWQLIAMMIPFILVGIIPFAHRRTMLAGPDYNLIMLLLLQPHYPLTDTPQHSLMIVVAVLAAPVAALAAFRLVYPVDPKRRLQILMSMMVHDLGDMAADPDAIARRPVWRARVFHRVLRLVRWSDKSGVPLGAAQAGLTVLSLGGAIQAVHRLREEPALRALASEALLKARRIGRDPNAVRLALARVADEASGRPEADMIREAAADLAAHPDIFRQVD